jgi:cell division protein FtsB
MSKDKPTLREQVNNLRKTNEELERRVAQLEKDVALAQAQKERVAHTLQEHIRIKGHI